MSDKLDKKEFDAFWQSKDGYAKEMLTTCQTDMTVFGRHTADPVTAKRYNDGKVDYTLIPVDAQTEEAKVWMMGAKKYSRGGWEKLWGTDTVPVVLQSLLRHAMAIHSGESHDEESGLQHAAHIRCNAAMLIRYFNENQNETN